MLSSIHPLGERAKGNRFGLTASAFALGAALGGAATGVVVGAVGLLAAGWVPDAARLGVVALVALAGAAFERTGRPLPSVPRQVDEDWLHEYRGWVYGAGFGFQLGTGVLTYITTAAVYVALAATLLAGHLLASVAIMGTFGLVRGLSILPARRIDAPDRLVTFHRHLHASAPVVRRVSTSALVVAGLAGGVALLGEL
ncbi:MAG TPA: hypothetical protein VFV42_08545 [Acidimicrobiales bacterium]|nr:hypothetical protein [Acidimicrobiales bacterium]